MPLLPLCAFMACYRVNVAFTFFYLTNERYHCRVSENKYINTGRQNMFAILTSMSSRIASAL
jgi:hypothetical protein